MVLNIFLIWLMTTISWWLFAFWPITLSAEWFLKAQTVCFGKTPDGLPEPYGWLMLTGAPLFLLITYFSIWWQDIKNYISRNKNQIFFKRALFICLLGTITFTFWIGFRIQQGMAQRALSNPVFSDQFPINYPRLAKPAPLFNLIDETGHKVTNEDLKGKITLVGFVFAHCQTMCPAIVGQIKNTLKKTNIPNVVVYLITLDPWRDTPQSLPAIAQKWGNIPNIHFLSATPEVITKIEDDFGIPAQRDMTSGDIVHAALTFIINEEGLITYILNNASSDVMAVALGRVQNP